MSRHRPSSRERRSPDRPAAPPPPWFIDPALGRMVLNAEERQWETTLLLDGEPIRFLIADDGGPSAALRSHATDIVRSWLSFRGMIADFLRAEAPSLEALGDEVRALRIDEILLPWPHRPSDGMIYFTGPDKYRVWRCDYINRLPVGLGFDD